MVQTLIQNMAVKSGCKNKTLQGQLTLNRQTNLNVCAIMVWKEVNE